MYRLLVLIVMLAGCFGATPESDGAAGPTKVPAATELSYGWMTREGFYEPFASLAFHCAVLEAQFPIERARLASALPPGFRYKETEGVVEVWLHAFDCEAPLQRAGSRDEAARIDDVWIVAPVHIDPSIKKAHPRLGEMSEWLVLGARANEGRIVEMFDGLRHDDFMVTEVTWTRNTDEPQAPQVITITVADDDWTVEYLADREVDNNEVSDRRWWFATDSRLEGFIMPELDRSTGLGINQATMTGFDLAGGPMEGVGGVVMDTIIRIAWWPDQSWKYYPDGETI